MSSESKRGATYSTPNGLLASAQELGFPKTIFRQLTGPHGTQVVKEVFSRFAKAGATDLRHLRLWNELRRPYRVEHGNSNLEIVLSLGDPEMRIWLLVEDWGRTKNKLPPYWAFESTLRAAVRTLDNHHFLEYYIVSRSFDWLVAEMHHEVLMISGDYAINAHSDFIKS